MPVHSPHNTFHMSPTSCQTPHITILFSPSWCHLPHVTIPYPYYYSHVIFLSVHSPCVCHPFHVILLTSSHPPHFTLLTSPSLLHPHYTLFHVTLLMSPSLLHPQSPFLRMSPSFTYPPSLPHFNPYRLNTNSYRCILISGIGFSCTKFKVHSICKLQNKFLSIIRTFSNMNLLMVLFGF